ncbi:hypothetical protein MA16_Dca010204 [Dendrobium catenatum]|uniref:Uncharacterized protein n=1 Tax=Dendrobium catenatum TaxID=906689 RepID=A0A2I0WAF3_9ASPA|nr:hypothetical protein MA16_Dca010204 [Dendrobium catenatum]
MRFLKLKSSSFLGEADIIEAVYMTRLTDSDLSQTPIIICIAANEASVVSLYYKKNLQKIIYISVISQKFHRLRSLTNSPYHYLQDYILFFNLN